MVDFAGGDGSPANPFLIATASDLQALATACNAGNKYLGVEFLLTADIDLTGTDWTPIGGSSAATPFSGSFDGGNHTIANITYNAAPTYSVGFFGYIQSATVKNLRISASVQSISTKQTRNGILAGRCDFSDITNCRITGSITETGHYSASYTGGICGVVNGSRITGCSFTGSVAGGQNVGGVAGYLNAGTETGEITDCLVNADLTATSLCGGILGDSINGTVIITRCVVFGTLSNSARTGGVFGVATSGTITIQASVSLLTSIGAATSGRISYEAAVSGCYARNDMIIGGTAVTSTDPTNRHGADVTLIDISRWSWWENLGFEFGSIWYWNAETHRPTLEESEMTTEIKQVGMEAPKTPFS